MKKMNFAVLLLLLAVSGNAAFSQKSTGMEVSAVPTVDLKRYAGKWYEIAKYPNKFQKDCVGNTTAEYSLKGNGKIQVTSRCITRAGLENAVIGEAKIADKTTNSKLKVRFAPSTLSFLPFVWGDYWIIELGDNYQYSVVGDPKREYFWILSREPEMSEAAFQAILRRAEAKGFQPGRVERTSQKIETVKGAAIDKN